MVQPTSRSNLISEKERENVTGVIFQTPFEPPCCSHKHFAGQVMMLSTTHVLLQSCPSTFIQRQSRSVWFFWVGQSTSLNGGDITVVVSYRSLSMMSLLTIHGVFIHGVF